MVEKSEIDQMAKFMQAIGGDNSVPSGGKSVSSDPGIAAMKTILEKYNSATDNFLAEAPSDQTMRDALSMSLTETGATYGNWEIIKKDKKYDVIHTATQEVIASDLMLYEAALGVARHLNEKGYINSKNLLEMLRYEQDYAGAVNDMIIYKHHLRKSPNSPRAAIYEDRYGAAKRKAVVSRDKVISLSERLY